LFFREVVGVNATSNSPFICNNNNIYNALHWMGDKLKEKKKEQA
jgi:hypothetical protein